MAAIASATLLVAACAGDAAPVPDPPDVRLVPEARSGPLPYSNSAAFAVADSLACVMDSYEVALVCGDRAWVDPRAIARRGRGPGEIGPYGDLLTWPGGAMAYLDPTNARLSYFSRDLRYAGSISVSRGSVPMSRTVDSVLTVHGMPDLAGPPQLRVRTLDAETGTEIDQVVLSVVSTGPTRDSAVMSGGITVPGGGYLVRVTGPGGDELAWFGADGSLTGRTELPDYGPVYPSDRDVEELSAGNRLLFGTDPTAEELRRFRARPLRFFPRGSVPDLLQFDDAGRLWALSTRPSDVGSYLEVFEDGRHAGALEVPGRVKSFRIMGSLLVALVEPGHADSVGVHPRRLDWYRIEAGTGDGGGRQ